MGNWWQDNLLKVTAMVEISDDEGLSGIEGREEPEINKKKKGNIMNEESAKKKKDGGVGEGKGSRKKGPGRMIRRYIQECKCYH